MARIHDKIKQFVFSQLRKPERDALTNEATVVGNIQSLQIITHYDQLSFEIMTNIINNLWGPVNDCTVRAIGYKMVLTGPVTTYLLGRWDAYKAQLEF